MVISIELKIFIQTVLEIEDKAWDDYRISKVQSRSQFEVDFGVNDAIGTIVTKLYIILFG